MTHKDVFMLHNTQSKRESYKKFKCYKHKCCVHMDGLEGQTFDKNVVEHDSLCVP